MKRQVALSGLLVFCLSINVYADVFAGKWKLFVGSNGTEINDAEPTIKLNISQKGTFYDVQVKLPVLPTTPKEGNFSERGGWGGFLQGEEERRAQLAMAMIRDKLNGKYLLSDDERSIEHLDGTVTLKFREAGAMICTNDVGCFKQVPEMGLSPGALFAEENYSEVFRPAPKKIRGGFSISIGGQGDAPKEDERILSLESSYAAGGKSRFNEVQEAIKNLLFAQKPDSMSNKWDDIQTTLLRYQQVELTWKEAIGATAVNYRVLLTTKDDSVIVAVDIHCTPHCRISPDKAIFHMGQIFDAAIKTGLEAAAPPRESKKSLGSGNGIVGVWRGTVEEPGESPYDVIVNFTSPDKAQIEYPSLNCKGMLSGEAIAPNAYKYRETISSGKCANSTNTVRLLDGHRMRILWSVGKITVSTTLTRESANE